MSQILEIKDLTKVYKNIDEEEKKAVNRVSFTVKKGEIFALLGANGAGKTTLIKMLLGLSTPTGGEIIVTEKKLTKDTLFWREKLGYLPERIALYPNLTAPETLKFFAGLRGVDKKRCHEVLSIVGLESALDRPTGQFSKGMLQRLGLAQAILGNPELLVLDEPTSGLDPEGAIQFKNLIRQLNKEGITIVFTSHILSEVQELADRIGIMYNGKLIGLGDLANLGSSLGLLPTLRVKLAKITVEYLETAEKAGALAVKNDDNFISFNCRGDNKFNILQQMEKAGAEIIDFYLKEPTLEDVFLQYLATEKGAGLQ